MHFRSLFPDWHNKLINFLKIYFTNTVLKGYSIVPYLLNTTLVRKMLSVPGGNITTLVWSEI